MNTKRHRLIKIISASLSSGIISMVLSLLSMGVDGFLWTNWLRNWAVAFCLVYLLSSIIPTIVSYWIPEQKS